MNNNGTEARGKRREKGKPAFRFPPFSFLSLFWPLLIVVAGVVYTLIRPGVWPWLLLVTGIVGGLWLAYLQPPSVRVQRTLESTRTFAGSPVGVKVTLEVRTLWPTLLTVVEAPPRTIIPDRPAALSGLFWGRSTHALEYKVTPNARGGFRWPAINLNWSDPLGLFVRDARAPLPDDDPELLVYPGTHALELPDLARPLLSDGPPSRGWGLEDPMSFAGVREYAPGDAIKRIQWKHTARFGTTSDGRFQKLIVRQLERVAATGVHVHLDLGTSGRSGETYLESATRLAASILQASFDTGLRVSVSSLTGETAPGGGFPALERALTYLARAQLEPNATPNVPIPPVGSNLVLVTMTAPEALIEDAIRARARAARVLVIALPEGFYLEPGESPRPLFVSAPDAIRALQRRAGVLEEAGVRVFVLRGDESVLRLA